MKELVILSGKGGVGKTSVSASLAVLAGGAVVVDCDVDAPDLHLVLEPRVLQRHDFVGGSKARIRPERCRACGKCEELCRFDAIFYDGPKGLRADRTFRVDPWACEGCGVCAWFCAEKAIEMRPEVCGQWFISETRCGPMVHARLAPGAENSGKLVTQLRRAAEETAHRYGRELILCDAAPGIGCPVIASLTGASLALVVAEPTYSGLYDFRRAAQLTLQMAVPAVLAINKADLNLEISAQLESSAEQLAIELVGRIPYDPQVIRAQMARKTVVEYSDSPAGEAIRSIWPKMERRLASALPSAASGLVALQPGG